MPSQKDKHIVHNFIEDGSEIFDYYVHQYKGDSPLIRMYNFNKDKWLEEKPDKVAEHLKDFSVLKHLSDTGDYRLVRYVTFSPHSSTISD